MLPLGGSIPQMQYLSPQDPKDSPDLGDSDGPWRSRAFLSRRCSRQPLEKERRVGRKGMALMFSGGLLPECDSYPLFHEKFPPPPDQ